MKSIGAVNVLYKKNAMITIPFALRYSSKISTSGLMGKEKEICPFPVHL